MLQTLKISRDGAIATVTLNRPPANAINLQLCLDLIAALDELEADPAIDAMVLTGRPKMFSAGLDVIELYALDRAGMAAFWTNFCEAFTRLYETPLATVAAIAGHAPAGGCVLSIACDHRVMAQGRFKIGLNEVAVGLAAPRFLCRVFTGVVGQRNAEKMLPVGAMVDPEGALAVGLVDEIVPIDDVMAASVAFLQGQLKVPQRARAATKGYLRQDNVTATRGRLEAELELLQDSWFGQECRRVMGELVARLSAPK